MHNYTVLNRFNTKTRVGNWYEQAQLNDFQFKEYLYNKEHSANQTLNRKTKLAFSSQPKQLSASQDGLVHIGDYVQLGNQHVQAVLSFNINEQILSEETYAVTTSKSMAPSLRNVFRIVPTMECEGDILKYGDKIRFQCEAAQRKFYLQSVAVSPMRSSKFSRNQEVSITCTLNSSSIWVVEHIDGKQRFDSVGKPVRTGQQVLIKHCTTGQWLASDKVTYVNDFGSEYEVFAKSLMTNNKTQNLYSEKVGHRDVENAMRNQSDKNSWRILKGSA